MRKPRQQAETDIYHIVTRGAGRQLIFEDDADRRYFLASFATRLAEYGGECYAWCLMGNHVHLLIRVPFEYLAPFMQILKGDYARYFNRRHGRIGHLFEGRFKSKPVNTTEQLLMTIRYIHRNPIEAGSTTTYDAPFTSYHEYTHIGPRITATTFPLECAGGLRTFLTLHDADDESTPPEGTFLQGDPAPPSTMSDEHALRILATVAKGYARHTICTLEQAVRNRILARLRAHGLSIRHIARLTGIGRGIIQRCIPPAPPHDTAPPPPLAHGHSSNAHGEASAPPTTAHTALYVTVGDTPARAPHTATTPNKLNELASQQRSKKLIL